MQRLTDPLNVELDAETEAICAEVCEAVQDFDAWDEGQAAYLRDLHFGHKWYVALHRAPDHRCRQQVFAAVDAIVRADRSLFFARGGYIFPRDQVRTCGGRVGWTAPDPESGEMTEMIEWPTGRTAGGGWWYEKPEDRAA